MFDKRVLRRLAAILAVDVAGYSRLMAADERGTLAEVLRRHREIFAPAVAGHGGRIVKLMGDGALVEFPSVVDAVACAVAVQRGYEAADAAAPEGLAIRLRIGVSLGDVIIEGRDIYGDGVNLASRLQEAAEPGEIVLAAGVHDQVANRLPERFADGGERALKSHDRPVQVFSWGGARGAPAAAGPALPEKPSIAVLPFDDLSEGTGREYLADGMADSITAALSRIRSFFVIARNSAFAYRGRATSVRRIGRELGVAYVLEGSLQYAEGRVRVTVQLVETAGGAHLWAEKYDGAVEEIFALQDRIAEQVAGALQPSIRLAEVERARRKPPQEQGAYDHAMQALGHVWRLERSAADTALGLLDEALRIDPDYPLALALAAWCWAQRSVYNWVEDVSAAQATALSYADRAASLSSDDPLILAVLGAVHTFARNSGAARVLLERAVALDPNGAWAWSRLGWLEIYSARPEAARPHFERAIRLSPLDPMNFNNYVGLGNSWHLSGEPAKAIDLYRRALQERPNALWIHRALAPALLGAGRVEEARESARIMMEAYPELTIRRLRAALVYSPEVLDVISAQMRELGVPE